MNSSRCLSQEENGSYIESKNGYQYKEDTIKKQEGDESNTVESHKDHSFETEKFENCITKSISEYRRYTLNEYDFNNNPQRFSKHYKARYPSSVQTSPIIINNIKPRLIPKASSLTTFSVKSPSNKPSEAFLSMFNSITLKENSTSQKIPLDVQVELDSKPQDRTSEENGSRVGWSIGSGFRAFRDVIASKVKFTDDEEEDDWDFWGKIVHESPTSVKIYKRKIKKKVYNGIPPNLRGIIWQTLTSSKDPELENVYRALLLKKSHYSNIIERDATRTFPDEKRFAGLGKDGQQRLFNIVNAYSVYDPETGYCQGIAFLAGILLLNIDEEGAFCTLVKLMNDYNIRDLYSQTMSGLNTKIHQFDCLLKELLPDIARHFNEIGVDSSMYVSQWFPLDIVFLIMDVLLVDGLDSIVLFSLGILSRSANEMISMDLEPLVEFLKHGIIVPYINNPHLLVEDYKALSSCAPRLAKCAKEHQKKFNYLQIGGRNPNDLQMELSITKGVLESIKNDFRRLNQDYMNLSKKYDNACLQIKRSDNRAKVAEDKLNSFLDSICSHDITSSKDDDMLYAEQLIKKNLEVVSENLVLKEKLKELASEEVDNSPKQSPDNFIE